MFFLAGQFSIFAIASSIEIFACRATTSVIHLARPRLLVEMPKLYINEVARMNVVAHLLSFIGENGVWGARCNALDQIREEPMQLGTHGLGP